jgi:hypothetical protein
VRGSSRGQARQDQQNITEDPRFITSDPNSNEAGLPSRKLSNALGLVRGPTRSARASLDRKPPSAKGGGAIGGIGGVAVGAHGNGNVFVSANDLTEAIRKEASGVRSDLAKNLELYVGGLGGGGK